MSRDRSPTVAVFYRLAAIETDECVLWPFMKNNKGYGYVRLDGVLSRCHVLVCEMHYGQRPAGHVAAHLPIVCHNRHCLNYRHLRWATHGENERDKTLDGTTARGESHHNSKLTLADVRTIRQLSQGGLSNVAIGKQFGVSNVQISRIMRGERWKLE